jgi:hypothetical protein
MLQFLRNLVNSPLIRRMVGGDFGAALDDQSYTIYVKGSKMAQAAESGSTIYDLDTDSVTIVDNEAQTYSVETFGELRAKIERAQGWMKHPEAGAVPFAVAVENTEQTRRIMGRLATKSLLSLTARSDSAWGTPVVKVTTWLVPVDPKLRMLADFSRRAAQKLGTVFTLVPSLFGAAGDSASAPTPEVRKLLGISVLDEIAVSGVHSPLAGLLGNGGDQTDAPVIQLEIQSSNFSSQLIEDTRFAIPAGFRHEQPNRPRQERN